MNTDKTEQVKVDQFKYAQSLFVECFFGRGKETVCHSGCRGFG